MKKYSGAALITGSTSGIGFYFSQLLASRGYDLILVSRNADKLESLKAELEGQYSVAVSVITCDLARADAAETVYRKLKAINKPVGLLIQNAGGFDSAPFLTAEIPAHEYLIHLHVNFPVKFARLLLPEMIENGGGGMIVMAAANAIVPIPWFSIDSGTKAFVDAWAGSLYGELKGRGIDVLSVCPGPTNTDIHLSSGVSPEDKSRLHSPQAVARQALKAIGKTPRIVTGPSTKLQIFAARFAPRALQLMISKLVTKKLFRITAS